MDSYPASFDLSWLRKEHSTKALTHEGVSSVPLKRTGATEETLGRSRSLSFREKLLDFATSKYKLSQFDFLI